MSFLNKRLPEEIQYGSVFGFGMPAVIQPTASGHEFRVGRASQARHILRLVKELQTTEQAMELKEFALSTRAALHSFRVKDWSDYTTNANGTTAPTGGDTVIGTGDGVETRFQLSKVYDQGSPTEYSRTITLPVDGTVIVWEDGIPTVAFTVNTEGVITFSVAPGNGVIVSAGCEFDVQCRFGGALEEYVSLRANAYEAWTLDQLELIEVLDELEWPELWWTGGQKTHPAGNLDITMSAADGQMHVFQQTASINVYLPYVEDIPPGDRVFTIHVKSTATGTIQLRDDSGVVVGSAIGAGATKHLALIVYGSSATWHLYGL